MLPIKQEVMISQEKHDEVIGEEPHYAKDTIESLQKVYETTKNYTGVGKYALETAEGIVKKTGVIEYTGLEKHIPQVIESLDNQINKIFLTESFSITKKLQDYQDYFFSRLPPVYYELLKDRLKKLEDACTNVQKTISEKAPKSEDLNQVYDTAVKRSSDLISAMLQIPGQDAFKSLPTSVADAVAYIKATPTILKKCADEAANVEQGKALLTNINALIDSVTAVFGQSLTTVFGKIVTSGASTTTSTSATITTTTITTTTTTTTASITTDKGRLC